MIKDAIKKAKQQTQPHKVTTPKREILPLIITSNPRIPDTRKIIQKYIYLLLTDKTLAHLDNYQIITVYRKPKNLKINLIRSSDPKNSEYNPGSHPCMKKCIACLLIKSKEKVLIKSMGEFSTIKGEYSCTSSSIIYLITCKNVDYNM